MQMVRLRTNQPKPKKSLRSQMKASERYSAAMLRIKFSDKPIEEDTQT